MNEYSGWKFVEFKEPNRQPGEQLKFPYHFLRIATEAEVREYEKLIAESRPLVDACDMFTPVDMNYKWLMILVDKKSIKDYVGVSYADINDLVSVQSGNYIFAYRALVEHWEDLINRHVKNDIAFGYSIDEFYNAQKKLLSGFPTIKALRNFLLHNSIIPLECGQSIDPDTGSISFVVWIRREELLRNGCRQRDDRIAFEALDPYFDLLPLLKESRNQIEHLQVIMYEAILLTQTALSLRDKVFDMRRRFCLEGHAFFPLKSSEFYPVPSRDVLGAFRPAVRLKDMQLRWGLFDLIDQYDSSR